MSLGNTGMGDFGADICDGEGKSGNPVYDRESDSSLHDQRL